jgi:TRAP-type mannitol/chloroaromatic compound transport system permease large subunit
VTVVVHGGRGRLAKTRPGTAADETDRGVDVRRRRRGLRRWPYSTSVTKLGLLSRMAERVTFVLIPPLALIFLVLGTIFLGIATPTEGGAMGAGGRADHGDSRVGARLQACSSRRWTPP